MRRHDEEIDFDHHSAEYIATWPKLAADLHARDYPLAWTEAHGGYWVLASWEDVKEGLENWNLFSSDNDIEGVRGGGRGVTIPRQPYPLVLNESDPPLSTARRQVEIPFFLPKSVRRWGEVAQAFLDESLSAVAERGYADLVGDILIPTTARTTLQILGYDMAQWEDALSAHAWGYTSPGDPRYPLEQMTRLQQNFREMLADRRRHPQGDLVSALAHAVVDGRPLTDEEGESMISALVFGGFDTTTFAAAHALIWLDQHRDLHARLIEDSQFLGNAIEEFLRMVTPAPGVARTATRPVELGGRRIEAGEHVYFWLAGANRDPRQFENPDRMWLERPNARDHLAFSAGGHRCLGAPLAKAELKAILASILQRLPDYKVDHAGVVAYPSFKSVNGLVKAPISFEPTTVRRARTSV
jgi:cytochrome P450